VPVTRGGVESLAGLPGRLRFRWLGFAGAESDFVSSISITGGAINGATGSGSTIVANLGIAGLIGLMANGLGSSSSVST
jgi:hypothetical protein